MLFSLTLVLSGGCSREPAPSLRTSSSSAAAGPGAPAAPPAAPPQPDALAKKHPPLSLEVAILAGGCFWGMEEILRAVPGVARTDVGYIGDAATSADYETVASGRTRHAEAVRVEFDPQKLSYAELLEKWFFRMHDPTTRDRQGNDVGPQYRSAIFVTSDAQRRLAQQVLSRVDKSGRWKEPIATTIETATEFTPAEEYHQDYLQKHPGGYTCHYLRD